MAYINKGTIASISGNTARVVPSDAGAKPTIMITIPWHLRGETGDLKKGTAVAYVEFDDFTGLLLGRIDGEGGAGTGGGGEPGKDGATFTPSVSDAGDLSWTNDKGLENPETVNIKGGPGKPGKTAYEYAQDGGYAGTEEEFAALLLGNHEHDASAITSGALPLSRGGTGAALTRTANAIIRYSGSSAKFSATATKNGALFATAANGTPQFGTLPIAQGGTGATTPEAVLSNLGITATAEELNHLSGAASNVQDQIDSKAASSDLTGHNTNTEAHADLRTELQAITDRINAVLDSDDTTLDELSEIVAYIKSNKSLIDAITTSKVSVADIVDNLVTNVANKPLSAAQGVVLKGLIDTLQTAVNGKANKGDIPTKTSQLANDSGFLTAHQDISGKANAADLTAHTGNNTIHITAAERAAWNKKADDFSIEIYNGTSGNPKPVRFASFNYSTCNSENGIAAKISLVSGHGNGSSYAFLQDAIIKVTYQGSVSVDNFKYYGASAGTYDGAARQYGDIFWLVDETNKIVDFYCLMGQYARVYQTPWKRLTYSSGGAVTQYTNCTVYSSGTKAWANNSDIALLSDVPTDYLPLSGGTMDGELKFDGGDVAGGSKIVLVTGAGQITNSGTQTLFGFLDNERIAVGHGSYKLVLRGSGARPAYNGNDLALSADIPKITSGTADLTAGSSALETGALYFVYE